MSQTVRQEKNKERKEREREGQAKYTKRLKTNNMKGVRRV